MTNHTDWRVHERDMMRAVIEGGRWKQGLTFNTRDMSSLPMPVLMVCGTSDPGFDGFDWEDFVVQTPDAAIDVMDGAGHQPWFDYPQKVAGLIRDHFQSATT